MVLIEGYGIYIQLFRERLSEKVHATIQKVIVGGFEFTVLQRKLIEWKERPWTCLRVPSYKVTCIDQVSHITFRDCRVHIFFRQPFSK